MVYLFINFGFVVAMDTMQLATKNENKKKKESQFNEYNNLSHYMYLNHQEILFPAKEKTKKHINNKSKKPPRNVPNEIELDPEFWKDFEDPPNTRSILGLLKDNSSNINCVTIIDKKKEKYLSEILTLPIFSEKDENTLLLDLEILETTFHKFYVVPLLETIESKRQEIIKHLNNLEKEKNPLDKVLKNVFEDEESFTNSSSEIKQKYIELENKLNKLEEKNNLLNKGLQDALNEQEIENNKQLQEQEESKPQALNEQKKQIIIKKSPMFTGLGLFFTGFGLSWVFNHFNPELNTFFKRGFSAILEKK